MKRCPFLCGPQRRNVVSAHFYRLQYTIVIVKPCGTVHQCAPHSPGVHRPYVQQLPDIWNIMEQTTFYTASSSCLSSRAMPHTFTLRLTRTPLCAWTWTATNKFRLQLIHSLRRPNARPAPVGAQFSSSNNLRARRMAWLVLERTAKGCSEGCECSYAAEHMLAMCT